MNLLGFGHILTLSVTYLLRVGGHNILGAGDERLAPFKLKGLNSIMTHNHMSFGGCFINPNLSQHLDVPFFVMPMMRPGSLHRPHPHPLPPHSSIPPRERTEIPPLLHALVEPLSPGPLLSGHPKRPCAIGSWRRIQG